jgi:SAM-dependent methyltransferase
MNSAPFDVSAFRFNSPLGKRILAVARGGDYAHPGEEEAIRLALGPFAGKAGHRWLDAGCGRGGTAHFVSQQGWAAVTAFDIDATSVAEAREQFPEVAFHACAVADAPRGLPGKFDLVYAFNAFYAFPDQPGALRALRELAADDAPLVLFDYTDKGGFAETEFARMNEAAHWRPIREDVLRGWLADAGWRLEAAANLDADYDRWYAWLVSRFDARREELLAFAPPEAVAHARRVYAAMLDAIRAGALGGGIFQARAV